MKVSRWLLACAVALPAAAWPLTPTCQKIADFDPKTQKRDFQLLEKWKAMCEIERAGTPSAKLMNVGAKLNLSGELQAAHRARRELREKLLEQARSVTETLRTMSPAQVAQLPDGEFVDRISALQGVRTSLRKLSTDRLKAYLVPTVVEAIGLATEAGDEGGDLARIILSRFEEAAISSDTSIAQLDAKILEVLQFGDAALKRLQTGALLQFDSTFKDGLLKDLGDAILDLRAQVAFEKFLHVSRLSAVLQDAQTRLNAGMLTAARGRVDYAEYSLGVFLAALPPKLSVRVAAGPARDLLEQIATTRGKADATRTPETEARLSAYVKFRWEAVNAMRASCAPRLSPIKLELAKIDADFAAFKEGRMQKVEDIEVRLLIHESLAGRLDTVRELCVASE